MMLNTSLKEITKVLSAFLQWMAFNGNLVATSYSASSSPISYDSHGKKVTMIVPPPECRDTSINTKLKLLADFHALRVPYQLLHRSVSLALSIGLELLDLISTFSSLRQHTSEND